MSVNDILPIPKTARYTTPANASDALPLVYGNMIEGSPVGAWILPCIDTLNFVYCLAGWEILDAGNEYRIFDDGNFLTTGYTVNPAHDFELQGVIATVTFSRQPKGIVTAACHGRVSDDVLLTNPIDIISDLLTYAETQGVSIPALNAGSFAEARNAAAALGYTCAGVIITENNLASWLTAILSSFLGEWLLNNTEELVIRLDTALLLSYQTVGVFEECNFQGISGKQSVKNIVNRCPVNYAADLSNSDKRFRENVTAAYFKYDSGIATQNDESILKYGERRPANTINLDWTRNPATVAAIQTRIVEKFRSPIWIYDFSEIGFQNIHVEAGDFALFSWEERRDETGMPLKNQIVQVMLKDVDADMERITWQLRDTGTYNPAYPDIFDGTHKAGDGRSCGGDRIS